MTKTQTAFSLPAFPEIPTIAEISPAYAALEAKSIELSHRLATVNAEIHAAEMAILDRRQADIAARSHEGISDRVASILGEAPPSPPKLAELPLREKLVQLREEASDLLAALNVVAGRLTTARMEASRMICKQAEPAMRAIVSELATKMAEVSHLAQHYRRFASHMNDSNVAWSELDPIGIRAGGTADRGSQFALWLNAAVKRGYISPDLLPQEIRA